ncbi:MYXO-CTERM sorting domain-containing protein [Mycobacterium interjectum]|uniref:MYXO-CTERM sorting domain-containing protein n=1 Tax=Mycobacterium interjectum TaxID=33895 RepID=UPI0035560BF6
MRTRLDFLGCRAAGTPGSQGAVLAALLGLAVPNLPRRRGGGRRANLAKRSYTSV